MLVYLLVVLVLQLDTIFFTIYFGEIVDIAAFALGLLYKLYVEHNVRGGKLCNYLCIYNKVLKVLMNSSQ